MTNLSSSIPPLRNVDTVASIAFLWAIAIALPLLDLLGRNAAFFVVRDAPPIEIIGLGVAVTLLLPLLLCVLALLAGRIHVTAGRVVHASIFVLLGMVLGLTVINRSPLSALSGWLQMAVAALVSGLLLLAYVRSPMLKSGAQLGLAAPFAVFGLFLFASPTSQLVWGDSDIDALAAIEIGNPAPIVFVVFDALPLADLMDGNGELQANVFPNFARLAEDGTWYRNTITAHYATERSVPAILSGVESSPDQLPTLADHPYNLFTLLEGTYEIKATEPITSLCPEEVCPREGPRDAVDVGKWKSLATDLRVIAGHLFLPEDMRAGLPAIDETWGGFGGGNATSSIEGIPDTEGGFDVGEEFWSEVDADRREPINKFIAGLSSESARPTLHFLHALVPHPPWNYLPSGQILDLPQGRLSARTDSEGWANDEWMIDQVHQLHLLQDQYADTVLGQILDQLQESEAYDETLIVVVSDHGESFQAGKTRHRGSADVFEDIFPVPLFIKPPDQNASSIDDYRAYTTDILPTIADILEVDLPFDTDGTSLKSSNRPSRTYSSLETADGILDIGTDGSEALSRAQEKVARFGEDGPFGLAPPGYADLLGQNVADLTFDDPASLEMALRSPERWIDVDTKADVLPVTVRGRVEGGDRPDYVMAIVLNDTIVAVTRSYVDANGDTHFDAILPPDRLREGANNLRVVVVEQATSGPTFHWIQ